MSIKQDAIALKDTMVKNRRHLHENPEIYSSLPKTTDYVMNELTQMGYEPKEICESGIVALVGKKPGKTVLLRADMDALGVQEETNLEFKSKNGYMHACGHDMHTAMLLGAAKILKDREDDIEGTVKLVFQPGEEIMDGAKAMIEAGVMDNPKVDVAFAAHVFSENPADTILIMSGPLFASSDVFRITIQGVGCHGAMPHMGVDPINVAAHTIINVQTLNAREHDAQKALVITIGKIDGAMIANIIPDKVVLEGTIRTFDKEVQKFAKKRLVEIATKTGETFNAKVNVEFIHGAPPLVVDEKLLSGMESIIEEALEGSPIVRTTEKSMGSEDFSYFADMVPSVYYRLLAGIGENPYPHHHPCVDFDENVMPTGAALLTASAIEWLKKQSK